MDVQINNKVSIRDAKIDKYRQQVEEMSQVAREIEEFRSPFTFEEKISEECVKIVLIGDTGDGKSTLGNRLSGDLSLAGTDGPFHTSNAANSDTDTIHVSNFTRDRVSFCVVDTPGFCDSRGTDKSNASMIAAMLQKLGTVNAFMLVRDVNHTRFDSNFQKTLTNVTAMLGDSFWRNVIVVLTHVDFPLLERNFECVKSSLPRALEQHFHTIEGSVFRRLPFFCIGADNFSAKVTEILAAAANCNSGILYSSENLSLPIREKEAALRDHYAAAQILEREFENMTKDIKKLQDSRNSVVGELASLRCSVCM
jgi:predicted GTPase